MVTFGAYQKKARETAQYPGKENGELAYPTLGLVGEAGEFAEKIKKLRRNRSVEFACQTTPEEKDALAKELGDIMWYVADMASTLGLNLEDVARMNIEKLADRQARNVIKSEGDNR